MRALLIFLLFVRFGPAQAVICAGNLTPNLQGVRFVSPEGTDNNSCGQDRNSPCKTIQQGIDNCKGKNCDAVLVRYGVYSLSVPLDLADGVSVYGGCAFDGVDHHYRSVARGNPAIRAENIKTPTTLQGFVVKGTSPLQPGESSIGMIVSNSTNLYLGYDVFESGRGADGAPGKYVAGEGQGGRGEAPKAEANNGGSGGMACPANQPGGANSTGQGGHGADIQLLYSHCVGYSCSCKNTNYPNSVGQRGYPSGNVLGGSGGRRGAAGCECDTADRNQNAGNGFQGHPGNPGNSGVAGGKRDSNTGGSFQNTTWFPAGPGGNGDAGQVGSGGGGGGSGGYGVYVGWDLKSQDLEGRPGGGGGGGGCGGPEGAGGQPGGASIPLVIFNSQVYERVPESQNNLIIPGPGGQGGAGADGGNGGPGGPGGGGQTVQQVEACGTGLSPGFGGPGGPGGPGGGGSGGAGGNGGPSVGLAEVSMFLPAFNPIFYPAEPGKGGRGGVGGVNGNSTGRGAHGDDGLPGLSATYQYFKSTAAGNAGSR